LLSRATDNLGTELEHRLAGTSGCSCQLEELKLSEPPCATLSSTSLCARGESIMERKESEEHSTRNRTVEEQIEQSKAHWSVLAESDAIPEAQESDYVTAALASEAVGATTLPFMSAVEEQIERSKAHWSMLADPSSCVEGEEVAEVSNFEEFKDLQSHPTWGGFFQTFGYELDGCSFECMGELEVGEKFAEGGQAEIYDAKVKWWNQEYNESDYKEGLQYVLKVFKKGTFLKQLKLHLPQGLLQYRAELQKNQESPTPQLFPRYFCNDGRFAFLMVKEHFDLRTLIECNMKLRSSGQCGPFSKEEAEFMMYRIALGVDWLHFHNIVHRDLKAANVLVRKSINFHFCLIADYECSNGVVGTGFFRAPEILQVCKERKTSERLEVFSRAADIYSYGMTCYEILVGKLPFEDHPLSDNIALLTDLVINQCLRPEVPEYVEDWKRSLLARCWQHDPTARPTIGEILDLLSANSTSVRGYEEVLKKKYGENFKYNSKLDTVISS
jgi:serine/threonine protein kinase